MSRVMRKGGESAESLSYVFGITLTFFVTWFSLRVRLLGTVNKIQRPQKMESNCKGGLGGGVKNQMHTFCYGPGDIDVKKSTNGHFHFRGGGSEKNGHYFPFPSNIELYLRSLSKSQETSFCGNENLSYLELNRDSGCRVACSR